MAKIVKIETETETQAIGDSRPMWGVILLGVGLGVIYWGLTVLIDRYIISQLFCNSSSHALTCLDSINISGNVATILVVVIGIIMMIRLRMVQPLIVSVAAAATLWGLAFWTSGLVWYEIILWNVLLYVTSYVLFSWIARFRQIMTVLVIAVAIITAARFIIAA